MFCSKCGRELVEGASFCSHCGADMRANENNIGQTTGLAEPVPVTGQTAATPAPAPEKPKKSKKGLVIALVFVLVAAIAAAILIGVLGGGTAALTKALSASVKAFEQTEKALALPDCSAITDGDGLGVNLDVNVESLPDRKELEGMGLELEGGLKAEDKNAELSISPKAADEELLELSVSVEDDTLRIMIPDIAGEKVYSIERGELDAVLSALGVENAAAEEMIFGLLDDMAQLSKADAARKEALDAFKKEALALLGELQIEKGEKLKESINGVETDCRTYRVTVYRESIYKLAEAAEKLSAAGADAEELSFAGLLPGLLTELADSNSSVVLELGVSGEHVVSLSTTARAYGENYSLRAEIGGRANYTDDITVKLTDANGEGWLLESSGQHSGSSFSDHSVLSLIAGGAPGEKLLVSQLHRGSDGSFELELSWAQGEKRLVTEGSLSSGAAAVELELDKLEIYSMGSLKAGLSLSAELGGYSPSGRLSTASEQVVLAADTVKDELYSLAGVLNGWLAEKGALLPEEFADKLLSDEFRLASALMGTVSAWGDALESLGITLPEGMKEQEGFGFELALALENLPYVGDVNGLGLALELDGSSAERYFGLVLRPFVGNDDLAKAKLSFEDRLLCLGSSEILGSKVYSLDTEKLGQFLGAFGLTDSEILALGFNVFEIAELYSDSMQELKAGSETLDADFAALAQELEVFSGGKGSVSINGSSCECELYAVNIYRETMHKALEYISAYQSVEMQSLIGFFKNLTELGLPEEIALEIAEALMDGMEEQEYFLDDLRDYIDTLPVMTINVAVSQGRIARAEIMMPVGGDEYITAGLELGGGENYTDDASFTLSNYGDEAYRLTSHSQRSGETVENRIAFSFTHRRYGAEEIFSLSSRYTPVEKGGEFETRFALSDEEDGIIAVEGRIESGDSLTVDLDSIRLLEGSELLAELSVKLALEPFDNSVRQGGDTSSLNGMSYDELESEWNSVGRNVGLWLMGLYAKYPNVINQFM